MQLPSEVHITDVTLRDGLQNEEHVVPTADKMALLRRLEAAGLRDFEVTSFVSGSRVPQLADAEELLAALLPHGDHRYAALVLNQRGYERALASRISDIVLVVSATDGHSRSNAGRDVAYVLRSYAGMLSAAADAGLRVRVSISTVFGCPFDGIPAHDAVIRLVDWLADRGVRDMTLCDTVGWADPVGVFNLFSSAINRYPETVFRAHLHDTGELGMANALAAMQAGVASFDASVGGLGGCPFAPGAKGNLASEKLVAMLDAMRISTGVSVVALQDAAAHAVELVGRTYRGLPDSWRAIDSVAPEVEFPVVEWRS